MTVLSRLSRRAGPGLSSSVSSASRGGVLHHSRRSTPSSASHWRIVLLSNGGRTTTRSFSSLETSPIVSTLQTKILALAEQKKDAIAMIKKSDAKVGEITAAQVFGGMRGMPGMVTETSDLHPEKGITYRGYSLKDANIKLPKAPGGGKQGLPEAAWWLLLTGEIPTDAEVKELGAELTKRAPIPAHVLKTLAAVPTTVHPMTQLSICLLALQSGSKFHAAYSAGALKKTDYWQYVLDDSLTLIAQIPTVAAHIYRRVFHDGKVPAWDPNVDWAGNYANMLNCAKPGNEEPFREITRLYLMLHADHEGGNVSSHITHTCGSALSDPFMCWAAGNCGLAGPLHGLANQECLRWLNETMKLLDGKEPTVENVTQIAKDTLASGKVVPGFGHAVLRAPDPRYMLEYEFCKENLPNDPTFKLADMCYQAIPPVLEATGKVKNPWPNVDALSGTVMQYYGLTEADYYTVVFSVSRVLGVTAQQVWSRVMGVPIERPNSVTLDWIKEKL
ncbi:unnamed protein product [Amoebophrya sp. A120]|nr:unnamed protein product [Amoebophrya sp. A120]|eukprot:GSA120T00012166001.1